MGPNLVINLQMVQYSVIFFEASGQVIIRIWQLFVYYFVARED